MTGLLRLQESCYNGIDTVDKEVWDAYECAICRRPVRRHEGHWTYELSDRRKLRLYAFAHRGECEAEFEKKYLRNAPELVLSKAFE